MKEKEIIKDLAMIVRNLVFLVKVRKPDNLIAKNAIDYLRRHNLQGDILRNRKDSS